jgi:hypothetical protein
MTMPSASDFSISTHEADALHGMRNRLRMPPASEHDT